MCEKGDGSLTFIISELTNLTSLELQNNNISDISPLKKLMNLTNINLTNNPITKADISVLNNTLQKLNIRIGDKVL